MSVQVYGCNHVAIEVDDINKAVAFYQDVFNLEKLDRGEGDAFFKLGEHQFLAIFEVDKVQPANLRHFGIMVRDEEQLAEVRKKLTGKYKLKLEPPFRCDFRDPWGNRIQVVDLHDESLLWFLLYPECKRLELDSAKRIRRNNSARSGRTEVEECSGCNLSYIQVVLSFVVPAYNEELELPATINANQNAAKDRQYEIIVVDDGSTDATAKIAWDAGAKVISINRRQIAAARNAGAHAANGEILFFVDGDTRINEKHVNGAIAALDEGCSGGGARIIVDGATPLW